MHKVKLPSLSLPEFEGTDGEWPPFWDVFESNVHSRPDLRAVDKFITLKGCLKGEALTLIRNILVTNENYLDAIDLLKKTYANPEKIISSLICQLAGLPKPSADLDSLRGFWTKLEQYAIHCTKILPRRMISDNATNFKTGSSLIQSLYDDTDVQSTLTRENCKWTFITPRAPHQGGFYERMVGSVKSALKKAIFKKRINSDELNTIVTEIERRINNRPLTYVDATSPDTVDALTPSHLLCGYRLNSLPLP
ncbi:uncharacterized protein LOC135223170 [Macrobrachium nipponense]|uniref:uncharacterized protein LOC135223170 n=1 Tax=Macrobrachium nipponense TaxID=159736 RepID=UPI0030C845CD